jgi:hypothetical protein
VSFREISTIIKIERRLFTLLGESVGHPETDCKRPSGKLMVGGSVGLRATPAGQQRYKRSAVRPAPRCSVKKLVRTGPQGIHPAWLSP